MRALLLLTLFVFSFTIVFSQGATCADAEPFCTGTTVTFPAGVDSGVGEAGNEYDCLGSQPNPAWYFMEIDQGGNLTIDIENYDAAGSSFDIDFILYGPYDDLASGKTRGAYNVLSDLVIYYTKPGVDSVWYILSREKNLQETDDRMPLDFTTDLVEQLEAV